MRTHTTQTEQVGVFPCRGLVAPCQRAAGSIKGLPLPLRCQTRQSWGGRSRWVMSIAVLKLEKGKFGFLDQRGGRLDGNQKLGCELTLRDGTVVYDLNGMTARPWETLPPQPPRTPSRPSAGSR